MSALNLVSRWAARRTIQGYVLLASFAVGCGVITWREVYISDQPDGSGQVRVEQKCGLADCSVRIVAKRGWTPIQMAYRRGCNINFAQGAWVGSVVGVFVDGGSCGSIKAATDTASGAAAPFSAVEAALRAAIVKDYNVGAGELMAVGGDALEWATQSSRRSSRSSDEFHRRYTQ